MKSNLSYLPGAAVQNALAVPDNFSDQGLHELIANERLALRNLDRQVTEFLLAPHKASHGQTYRIQIIELDRRLNDIRSYVDDRIAESDPTAANSSSILIQLDRACNELIGRNNAIGSKIDNDMIICLTNEAGRRFDPMKFATFFVGFPAALAVLARAFWGERAPQVEHVIEGAAAVGAGIGLHDHIAKGCNAASHAVCGVARKFKKDNLRKATLSTAVTLNLRSNIVLLPPAEISSRENRKFPRVIVQRGPGL
jgi:hypothetical protein